MAQKQKISSLESLPQDLLGDIISKVAKYGHRDIRNCLQVSHELAIACQDGRVSKNLNLMPLAINPLATLNKYQPLMEKCLQAGNPEAHYIQGIKEYFYNDNIEIGLPHLQASAEGERRMEEGKKYLDKLEWAKSTTRSDRCWTNIKESLEGIPILQETVLL
ncbi:PREDICTED: F-box protein At2g35280-like [Camelina sativa]|uniref:F-box protein At2g35280-like n=1 Tax=Camelina sativa TaxID=90675 RepID=A0ABM1QFI3_CAMSA|nr:PREDICTED: F-box protein At2g35280-like [Camelina sativa]